MRTMFINPLLRPLLLLTLCCSSTSHAQDPAEPFAPTTVWENHPSFAGATSHTYKTASGADLKLFIFNPPDHQPSDKIPAIVFFFGGAWTTGTPTQFAAQASHLASRGMVAACADYRLRSRHNVTPAECVADAKSAVRWIRAHASELGIDPDRIAVGGGSAGGHIAACTGVITGFDEPGEDTTISSVANALILFNPALDVTDLAPEVGFGENALALSPALHVRAGAPPTIIFHGRDDRMVPIEQAERFTAAMVAAGNRCELISYDGEGHGFFNHANPTAAPPDHAYHITLQATDFFLVSLGWLDAI